MKLESSFIFFTNPGNTYKMEKVQPKNYKSIIIRSIVLTSMMILTFNQLFSIYDVIVIFQSIIIKFLSLSGNINAHCFVFTIFAVSVFSFEKSNSPENPSVKIITDYCSVRYANVLFWVLLKIHKYMRHFFPFNSLTQDSWI